MIPPWRIPSAYVCDLNASYRFKIGGVNAILSGVVNNLFDQEYISDATDGSIMTGKLLMASSMDSVVHTT